MMYWSKRIYYDITTGEVIRDTGGFESSLDRYTVDYEVSLFKELTERNRETFEVLELEPEQYEQDFTESIGYRVNPETLELEFSYPDPNEPEVPQEFRPPLSTEVDELKQENLLLKAQNNALSERAEFIEDVVAEIAMQVYQ